MKSKTKVAFYNVLGFWGQNIGNAFFSIGVKTNRRKLHENSASTYWHFGVDNSETSH